MPTFLTSLKSPFWIFLLLMVTICGSANSAEQTACDTLVTETQSVCMDMARRGLDVSCSEYLMAIDMAMDQASGSLFDVGDENASAANSFCSAYVDNLREDRKEHDASMRAQGQAGPECTALADRFEKQCMSNLGKEKPASACETISQSFAMMNSQNFSQEQQEIMCTVYGAQLPEE